jgi:hypothetical protein
LKIAYWLSHYCSRFATARTWSNTPGTTNLRYPNHNNRNGPTASSLRTPSAPYPPHYSLVGAWYSAHTSTYPEVIDSWAISPCTTAPRGYLPSRYFLG